MGFDGRVWIPDCIFYVFELGLVCAKGICFQICGCGIITVQSWL
jgi:hypothetical protein